MKPNLLASALFLLLINSVISEEMVTHKASQYQHSLDGICPEIQIVVLPHPDPDLCHMFVLCVLGQPKVYECVDGYFFDPSEISCIPDDREQCVRSSPPTWKEICATVSYAFLPDPDACWEFVLCFNGLVNRFTCPANEIWSQRAGSCLPGNRKTCVLMDTLKSCQDRPDGVLPHPEYCSKYIECSYGEAVVVDCLRGEVYNEQLGKCVVGNTETCTPQENMCKNSTDGYVTQHPNECNLYVSCENGVPVTTECRPGEIFNDYVKYCAPGDARTCQFNRLDTVCQGKNGGTIIPYPDSCNRYIRCDSGVAVIKDCTEGMIMHAPSGTCRLGNHQTCEFIVDACDNKPDGWVIEHPNFCHIFIRCESQIATIEECTLGTILRPDAQVCVPGIPYACTYAPFDTMCIDRRDGRIYPHPSNCRMFIRCFHSQASIETCVGGILDPKLERCAAGYPHNCTFFDANNVRRSDEVILDPLNFPEEEILHSDERR